MWFSTPACVLIRSDGFLKIQEVYQQAIFIFFLIKVIFLPAPRYFSIMCWLSRTVYFVPLFPSCYGKWSCSCFSFLLDQNKLPESQQPAITLDRQCRKPLGGWGWPSTAVHSAHGRRWCLPMLCVRTSPAVTLRSQLTYQGPCCRNMPFGRHPGTLGRGTPPAPTGTPTALGVFPAQAVAGGRQSGDWWQLIWWWVTSGCHLSVTAIISLALAWKEGFENKTVAWKSASTFSFELCHGLPEIAWESHSISPCSTVSVCEGGRDR